MARHVVVLSLAFFLALGVGTSNAALDTSGSTVPYGKCKKIAKDMFAKSHWCSRPALTGKPSRPGLKYGRQSIFSGPVGKQQGWCGKILRGSNTTAVIAISSKYLPLHGVSPNSQYCGKCMCVRVRGPDETTNPHYPKVATKYAGKIFKGIVHDMCPECEDDHIDVLADRPYTQSPQDRWNPNAKMHNAIPGPRIIPHNVAYGVGIWKVEWNFVPCATNCQKFFGVSTVG
jgi:hypothetical protein